MHEGGFNPTVASDMESENQPVELSQSFFIDLFKLVSRNRRVRLILSKKGSTSFSKDDLVAEIVQEIVVRILASKKWRSIGDEGLLLSHIRAIELPQLLNESLKKQLPERFRISRRIWKTVRSNERFSVISAEGERDTIYDGSLLIGLSSWTEVRSARQGRIERGSLEPIRRNLRVVGRGGSSQLIISESRLRDLLIEILEAADGHLPLSRLKAIATSFIQVNDPGFVPFDDVEQFHLQKGADGPHEQLIRKEELEKLPEKEKEFLLKLKSRCRRGSAGFDRMLRVLCLCVLSHPPLQRRQVAKRLGVAPSLISRDISVIREVCRSLSIEDEELRLLLKERLEKSLERFLRE